jgi:hypothetical protein
MYCINKKLTIAGGNDIKVSWKNYKVQTGKNKLMMMECVHNFQHEFDNQVLAVKKSGSLSIEDKVVLEAVNSLLLKIQNCIKQCLGLDLSIHIKLFYNDKDEQKGKEYMAAQTYGMRLPSRREFDLCKSQLLQKRSNDEIFNIDKFETNLAKDICDKVKGIIKRDGEGKFKKNSAYDFALSETDHFWVSNDLRKHTEIGHFISNSARYDEYYNSLAVFIIAPQNISLKRTDTDNIYGLLVVDSNETNIFHKNMTRFFIGYFAHRLFDFFVGTGVKSDMKQ